MTVANFIVVYLVCWWLVLFMVLPWGVKVHNETGEEYESGIDLGSPVKATIGRKMLITTAITTVIVGIFWSVMEWGLISIS